MRRLDAIVCIFEELSKHCRSKYTVYERLQAACLIVLSAERHNEYLAQINKEYVEDLKEIDISNPFQILEDEIKAMRLDENEDWE